MAKIKLIVSSTIEETFQDFILSRKTKGLAEKTLQSYQSQFRAVAQHLDVSMEMSALKRSHLDAMILSMRDRGLSPNSTREPSNPFSPGATSKVSPISTSPSTRQKKP